jgi:hypothetical protein
MTGRRPVRILCGLCVAAVLAACGPGGVDPAADEAAASAAGQPSPAAIPGGGAANQQPVPTPAAAPGGDRAGAGSRGNPGAPGADPAVAGGGAPAQGNPGAPGDVAVFEEAGVPYRVLADDAGSRCTDGVCTLLAPVVGAGRPDDVGGIGECLVHEQSDIRYDPPAQGGLFRHGATVQATVDCTVQDSGTGGTQTGDGSGTSAATSGSSSAATATSGGAVQDQAPADRSQG